MSTVKFRTYRSDGSDGYSPGTYGWTWSDDEGNGSSDGGWHSREQAREDGLTKAPAESRVVEVAS